MSKKGYEVFVDGLLLPIAPSKITVKIKNENKVITLLNGQELNLINAPGLTDIDMDILLPSDDFAAVMNFQSQSTFLDKFESLKKYDKKSKVFSLIINRSNSKGGLADSAFQRVTLEDYKINEDVKQGFELPVTLSFKQYIPPIINKLTVKEGKDGSLEMSKETSKINGRPDIIRYTVKENDTLSVIVKQYLGETSIDKINEIAKKNNISNPNILTPGTVIEF